MFCSTIVPERKSQTNNPPCKMVQLNLYIRTPLLYGQLCMSHILRYNSNPLLYGQQHPTELRTYKLNLSVLLLQSVSLQSSYTVCNLLDVQ